MNKDDKKVKLSKTELEQLSMLCDFIDYSSSNETTRRRMRHCAFDYITEVLRDFNK